MLVTSCHAVYETLGEKYKEGMRLKINYVRKKHLSDYLWDKDIYPEGKSSKRRSEANAPPAKNGDEASSGVAKKAKMMRSNSDCLLDDDTNNDSNDASNVSINNSVNNTSMVSNNSNTSIVINNNNNLLTPSDLSKTDALVCNGGFCGDGDASHNSPIVSHCISYSYLLIIIVIFIVYLSLTFFYVTFTPQAIF